MNQEKQARRRRGVGVPARAWALACVLLTGLLASPEPGLAQAAATPPTLEYQVKASMIYNFLQFMTWPKGSSAEPVLSVCIVGQDRFGPALQTIEGAPVRGRTVQISRFASSSAAARTTCHVAFISNSEQHNLERILGDFRGKSVLTIGEGNNFIERGGLINFVLLNGRVRFEVNRRIAMTEKIDFSSKLLRLAYRVLE